MKTILSAFVLLALGVVSGWHSVGPEVELPVAEPESQAITFRGNLSSGSAAADVLSANPGGLSRSRAELLALLEEANRSHDAEMRKAILAEWARHEDGPGIRAVFDIGNRLEGWQLLRVWAEFHPADAARLAEDVAMEIDPLSEVTGVIGVAMVHLLLTEPEKAVSLEETFFRLGGEWENLRLEKSNLSAGKTQAILEALADFKNKWMQGNLFANLARSGALDPRRALEWAEEEVPLMSWAPGPLKAWIDQDSAAAGRYMTERLDGSKESVKFARSFVVNLGLKSPDELLAWLDRQDPERLVSLAPIPWYTGTDDWRKDLRARLQERYPDLADGLGPRLPSSSQDQLPKAWPPANPEEASAWYSWLNDKIFASHLGPETWTAASMSEVVAMLPNQRPGDRLRAAQRIAEAWGKRSPAEAIAWASDLPDDLSVEVADVALKNWFTTDPPSARAYVETLPSGEYRCYAVERVAGDWAKKDAKAASNWLATLPPGLESDVGRRAVADAILGNRGDPELAWEQARAMSDPRMRLEWTEAALRDWAGRDPDRVLELIPTAGFSPEIEAKLRKNVAWAKENQRKRANRP